MHGHKKHNACNRLYSLRALRFSCVCTACVAMRTTAWKPTFKSVFCMLTVAALFRRLARVGLLH